MIMNPMAFLQSVQSMNHRMICPYYMKGQIEASAANTHHRETAPASRESVRIEERIGSFEIRKSNACVTLFNRFGDGISQGQLKAIATHISSKVQDLNLDRDAKRRKGVLLKWFDENWDSIRELLCNYTIEDGCVFYKGKPVN